eukprot:19620-Hanusia_phi.AAC.1
MALRHLGHEEEERLAGRLGCRSRILFIFLHDGAVHDCVIKASGVCPLLAFSRALMHRDGEDEEEDKEGLVHALSGLQVNTDTTARASNLTDEAVVGRELLQT